MPKQSDPFARLRAMLRQRREELGLKVSEVAVATNVGANKIRHIEDDENSSPRLIHVARLAAYYGLSGDAIFAQLDLPSGPVAYLSTADGYDTADLDPM